MPVPFGSSASPEFTRAVPIASQIGIHDGWASFTDGFPPINALPVQAGGIPPFMQDFNGLLNAITAWVRWQNAGGPIGYDATFAAEANGYPLGALVAPATTGAPLWLNTVDGNQTNPDTGGAGWVKFLNPIATNTANGIMHPDNVTLSVAGDGTLSVAPYVLDHIMPFLFFVGQL
jgi:hypothetical protein